MKWWEKILKWLEKGHIINAYTELYAWGVIDREEYLQLIKEIEEDE